MIPSEQKLTVSFFFSSIKAKRLPLMPWAEIFSWLSMLSLIIFPALPETIQPASASGKREISANQKSSFRRRLTPHLLFRLKPLLRLSYLDTFKLNITKLRGSFYHFFD